MKALTALLLPRRPALLVSGWQGVRRVLRIAGPGYLVAVGYMDPGNWATDIAGGAGFGYELLAAVLLASIAAMALQALVVRVTLATGTDLAALLGRALPRRFGTAVWLAGEAAILATALAEMVGTAIALNLLFGLPLLPGMIVAAVLAVAILAVREHNHRAVEGLVIVLVSAVALAFAVLLAQARPDWLDVAGGLLPAAPLVADPGRLVLAIGILGATVMPHNLYLHSGLVAERAARTLTRERRGLLRLLTGDTLVALTLAFLVNGAILVLAGTSLAGLQIDSLAGAHHAIGAVLGPAAALLFAVALFAAGQSSTITGALAGGMLTRGFARRPMPAWLRGLVLRLLALPAALALLGPDAASVDRLLVLSQVALSLALPFVLLPLVGVAGDKRHMGGLVLPRAARAGAWALALAILGLNLWLVGAAFVD